MSGLSSLQEFVTHSIWPYVLLYVVYAVLKYGILTLALCFTILHRKRPNEAAGVQKCIGKLAHKLVYCTIGIFPEKLILSARIAKMDDEHVMVLAVHCISLITVALVIATKLFWRNIITNSCSTDPNVHCFPQILNGNDSRLVPSISLQARTNDCSRWMNETFIERITFLCFEFEYSIAIAIVALGGVVALFKPTMNFIISTANWTYKSARKCRCGKKCDCGKVLNYIQLVIGLIGIPIEVFLVCAVLATGIIAGSTVDEFFMNTVSERVAMFFITHGIVILFIFGIIHTSFFIPWDFYVKDPDEDKTNTFALE